MSEPNAPNNLSDGKWKIRTVNIILIIAAVGGLCWGAVTYLDLGNDLYTNDAQVEEYINPINTRIPGYIRKVYFQEHQKVKKGDTLITIDDREYKIQVEEAQAAYLSALASKNVTSYSVNTVHSNVGVSEANVRANKARLLNAQKNLVRYENLLKDGAATQQQYDQVKSDYDAMSAQTSALEQQKHTQSLSTDETSKRLLVNDAEIKRTHAALDMALLNLSYTNIIAPYDGFTGRRNIQEGQLLQAGQTLLSFVRNDDKWVIANFTEEQVVKLHIGDKLKISIDGLNDREIGGEVAAISEATGSRYSSIPLDNSTGNFVKVRQRVPVRIAFVKTGQLNSVMEKIRAGMNVVVRLAN
ncbi:HlyD family secretion protein [Mucilaginibacter sp.]|jgi:membrane fusion protein (multidrug efflux system)|uniref:HlyD family secretion protein n=1 Tax=Mucilaginibacter sp. TaxID=1882438 RepID=UPI003568F8FA